MKMLGAQTLEPVTLLGHMTKGMKLACLWVAQKFLTIRLREAQWKRWDSEPKNTGPPLEVRAGKEMTPSPPHSLPGNKVVGL